MIGVNIYNFKCIPMVKDAGNVSTKKKMYEPGAVNLRRWYPLEVNWKGREKGDSV